jgi:hypothetical protein
MIKEYDKYAKLAKEGTLPAAFSQWGLADEYGWTVAHWAAFHGDLPADFTLWDLADKNRYTVAHAAAVYGHLPEDFTHWGLANNDGLTVLHQLLSSIAKSDKYMTRWEKERPLCEADEDWKVFRTELPEVYQKHTIREHMLDADNDQEALYWVSLL